MTAARRDRAFGTVTGWWATAARALALVMALAVAAPATGLAEDFAFHLGHQDRQGTEFVTAPDSSGTQAPDPGLDGHVHCGCHLAVGIEGTDTTPRADTSRPNYARLSEAVPSVFLDRLPRPPRG